MNRLSIPLAWRSLLADVRYAVPAKRWLLANDAVSWDAVYDAWSATDVTHETWGELACDEFRVLGDNAESFRLREALARGAKAIDVATYYIAPDDTGWAIAETLIEAVGRGARVRLLVDAHMTRKRAFERPETARLIDALRRGGVELRLYRNAQRPFEHCHWKMFVVDGRSAITGGRNFADHYRQEGWRDVDLFVAGEAAGHLERIFDAAWLGQRLPRSGPFFAYESRDLSVAPFWQFLHAILREARATIDIEHAYVVPHTSIVRALEDAVKRGVRVRLLTNSSESNDLVHARWAQARALATLASSGVAIHQRAGKERTLHGKYVVVDGSAIAFGSMNLDYFSPRLCAEITLHTRHQAMAAALTAFFEEGLADATPFAGPPAQSFGERALGQLAERFFHEFI